MKHNKRKQFYTLPNVDVKKSSNNIALIDDDLHETYTTLFQDAVKQHDANTKRSDRKINDYYEYSKKLKSNAKKGQSKPLFIEFVVQFGSRKTLDQYGIKDEKLIKMYKRYVELFIKNNPKLHVFGAYIHLDEKTPHLHLDVVPCSSVNKKMALTNSFNNALVHQNFNVREQKTGFRNWRNSEINCIESVFEEFNINREIVGNTKSHSVNAHLDLDQKYTTQIENLVIEQSKNSVELNEKLKPFKAKIKTGFAKSEEIEVVKASAVNELIEQKTALELQNQMQKNSLIDIKKQNDSFAKRDLNSDATKYKTLYEDALNQIDDMSNELIKSEVRAKKLQQLNDTLNADMNLKDKQIEKYKITICDMYNYIQKFKSSSAPNLANAKTIYGEYLFDDEQIDLINNSIDYINEKGE